MVSYYDRLKDAFQLFEKKSPASSARLLGLYLLHLHNANMNCGTIQVTDRELANLTGLSKNTITESKRTLKNLGLIDFKTDKSTPAKMTTYFFSETLGQGVGQTLGQTLGQAGFVCHTQQAGAMDCGESFPPAPPFKEDLRQKTAPLPPQGATEGDGLKDTQASERETVEVARTLTDAERESFEEFAEETASLQDAKQLGTPDVCAVWNENRLPWLGADQKYRLAQYEEEYGFGEVSAAIIATKDKHTYPTFAKFEKILGSNKSGDIAKQATAVEYKSPSENDGNKAIDEW